MKNLFESCDYVICDRSFYSNFMYQAAKIYIKNIMYYNSDSIPAELYNWISKNSKWEISDTGLYHCEDIQTFVLSLSEEDSLKQLNNRAVKDTNEMNRVYLNECKKFINHMMSVGVKDSAQGIMNNVASIAQMALKRYIIDVHPIEVVHADDPKDIPAATMQTVNKICEHLGIPTSSVQSTANKKVTKVVQAKTGQIIATDYLTETTLACNMLSALWYALLKSQCDTSDICKIYAEYSKGELIPDKICYSVNHSKYRFYMNPRFTTKIITNYMLKRAFPYAVRFIYNPKMNTFNWEAMEDLNNEN